MAKKDKRDRMELLGVVTQAYKGGMFDVSLDNNLSKTTILATICGKMRKLFIKVVPGDEVLVELSPYDLSKGRIVRRIKS